MTVSRRLEDLAPPARTGAEHLLALAREADFDLLIYCTYRSHAAQARLYRQGRALRAIEVMAERLNAEYRRGDLAEVLLSVGPQYGPLVTHAAPGQSLHGYGLAFDAVPLFQGKPVWTLGVESDRRSWARFGALVEESGLEWAGRWPRFREYPHAQVPGMRWQELIAGAAAPPRV